MSAAFATDELGPRGRRRVRVATAVSIAALLALGWVAYQRLASRGQFEAELYTDLLEPVVFERLLLDGFVATNLRIAVVATALSLTIGLGLALARLARNPLLHQPLGAFVEFFRAIPVLLFIFLIRFGLPEYGADFEPATYVLIALTCYHSAVLAEVFRAGILSLPSGQGEAATSLGMTYWQSMRQVIVPQAVRRMSPAIVSQLVTVIKDSTLGFIVAGGYRDALRQGQQIAEFLDNRLQSLLLVALIFILACYALSWVAARLEARQRRRFGAGAVRVEGGPEDLMATGGDAGQAERAGRA
jgi:glutamate transport system permease protein